MNTITVSILLIALYFGMILCLEAGRRLGRKKIRQDPEGARAGVGTVEGVVFALLGLIIAFTFSGAAGRFDARRALVLEEANDIGTAYLRVDLVPPACQPELRALFRLYVDKRIEAYRRLDESTGADFSECLALQSRIWDLAVRACQSQASPAPATLLLPALNDMFDISTSRTAALKVHPPLVVFAMLGVLALASSLLAGFNMASANRPSWLHIMTFATVIVGTIYMICDIELPRSGLIRVNDIDRLLMEVRAGMK